MLELGLNSFFINSILYLTASCQSTVFKSRYMCQTFITVQFNTIRQGDRNLK